MKNDICVIVEGSYPYVTGGVSSWLHRYLKYFSDDYSFSIVALTAGKKTPQDFKYQMEELPNIKSFKSLDIFDYSLFKGNKGLTYSQRKNIYPKLLNFLLFLKERGRLGTEGFLFLKDFIFKYREKLTIDIMNSEKGFSFITQLYQKTYREYGFLKYYYNFKNILYFLSRTLLLYPELPEAKIYHSISTGLAGLLAVLKTYFDNSPSLITEHGIYVQERAIELANSSWLDEFYLKVMWIEFFKILTLWQYENVTQLTTLSQYNKELQIEFGAQEEKIEIIPNGINLEKFKPARKKRLTSEEVKLGLVGRIDPIKDIKTFVNTVAIVKNFHNNLKAYIIGPVEKEKENYLKEIKELIKILKLENNIVFTGRANVVEYFEKIDILLLTSIKEAMPLVILEAMASQIPIVSTRVGSCEEMLFDSKIGRAGYTVPVMDSYEMASKVIDLIKKPQLANQMALNGVKIVETRYREDKIMEKYSTLYQKYLEL